MFDNNLFYDEIKALDHGKYYTLKGWVKQEYKGGCLEGDKYIVDLDECPEPVYNNLV